MCYLDPEMLQKVGDRGCLLWNFALFSFRVLDDRFSSLDVMRK